MKRFRLPKNYEEKLLIKRLVRSIEGKWLMLGISKNDEIYEFEGDNFIG
jgi:hypothetical protein